jgi:hypothetical protein
MAWRKPLTIWLIHQTRSRISAKRRGRGDGACRFRRKNRDRDGPRARPAPAQPRAWNEEAIFPEAVRTLRFGNVDHCAALPASSRALLEALKQR